MGCSGSTRRNIQRDIHLLLRQLADVYISALNGPRGENTFHLPHDGVEQADFGAIVYDLFHPFLVHAPIVGTVEKLIFRPADI